MKQSSGDVLLYVEWVEAESVTLGEALLYVEYVGDAAGAYTPNIPTVQDIILYVEYQEVPGTVIVPEIMAYVEYEGGHNEGRIRVNDTLLYVEWVEAESTTVGEAFLYVEYTGDAAGAYTPNIPTVSDAVLYVEYLDPPGAVVVPEILAYVEFIYDGEWPSEEEVLMFVFGPLAWMT